MIHVAAGTLAVAAATVAAFRALFTRRAVCARRALFTRTLAALLLRTVCALAVAVPATATAVAATAVTTITPLTTFATLLVAARAGL